MSNNNLKIYKWNIYNAIVPFTVDFSQSKERPVIVLGIIGEDVIILPISTKIEKKQKIDFDIDLDYPSIIKTGNIQSIHIKDIISPYVNKKDNSISKISKRKRKKIINQLKTIIS